MPCTLLTHSLPGITSAEADGGMVIAIAVAVAVVAVVAVVVVFVVVAATA